MKLSYTQQKHVKRLSKNELYKAYMDALTLIYTLEQTIKKQIPQVADGGKVAETPSEVTTNA